MKGFQKQISINIRFNFKLTMSQSGLFCLFVEPQIDPQNSTKNRQRDTMGNSFKMFL